MDSLGENDVILFQDECSVQFAPTLIRTWSLKGQQPKVLSPGGRKRQPIIGAVDPFNGLLHVGLSDSLKAEQFQHFLERLIGRYKDREKILVVLDNARAHHSKRLEPFLNLHKDKLELMFLPPYSPHFNPIERVWKFMRKQVTHNTFFQSFKEFLRALVKFFTKFKLPNNVIKSLCKIS